MIKKDVEIKKQFILIDVFMDKVFKRQVKKEFYAVYRFGKLVGGYRYSNKEDEENVIYVTFNK